MKKTEIKEIIKNLTIEEKALLLTGGNAVRSTGKVDRFNIPVKTYDDGPHGLANGKNPVCFPSTCGVAATWNRELTRKLGNALASECINQDVDILLAPGINLKRSILCGRNFEYYSEDPILTAELASEYINGVEEKGVSTSLKHFAANNMETYRLRTSADLDEKTLRELYTRSFEITLRKSKPASVMCAYNKYNGTWCSENYYLLTELLRNKFGYEGFVVSDWGAVRNVGKACAAGLDLQMPTNSNIVEDVKNALKEGTVVEKDIDRALEHILEFLFREKAVDNKPYSRKEQHEFARKVARESICLLRNDDNVLPISKKAKKIGIIGDLAINPVIDGQGAAEVHPNPECIDIPIEEIKKNFKDSEIIYIDCLHNNAFPTSMPWNDYEKWFTPLKDCDYVVMFTGFPYTYDSENTDKPDAHLFPYIEMMMKEIRNKYCSNLIVVLQTGAAVCEGPWIYQPKGLIEMWLAGEGGGKAIADVLSGDYNPSGKITETFPRVMRTDMDLGRVQSSMKYTEQWQVGYRYYDLHPEEIWYPFGFGLSYTSYEYSNLDVLYDNNMIRCTLDIENVGDVAGSEIAQLYMAKRTNGNNGPIKELKGFQKVKIEPHKKQSVEIMVDIRDICDYDENKHDWVLNNGEYLVMVGSSSRDIRLEKSIKV
ncbi:MAG: glycoside hydrolase family 3 C-terminal domain-containing protein [Clostridia bacterium]|nr:glycoside hydrolase family 3 C-terminal domain-containing protein [Clostridia bacterium]